MKIGIDIDDTITNTKETTKKYLKMYDHTFDLDSKEDLKNKKTFDFLIRHIEDIQSNVNLKPGVKEAFNELKNMGYEIIIITARGEELDYEYERITKDFLNKYNLPYDKIFFGNYPKGNIAKKENLSIFVDDRLYNLDDVSQHGIKCLHFVENLNINSPYKKFNNWDDIIIYLKNKEEIE